MLLPAPWQERPLALQLRLCPPLLRGLVGRGSFLVLQLDHVVSLVELPDLLLDLPHWCRAVQLLLADQLILFACVHRALPVPELLQLLWCRAAELPPLLATL